jgi:cation diffusion facilitator CzcD-associated flavoprotein CzcO
MDSDQSDHGADVEVAIVGSGYAGLCMGIKLRERGIADFVILEQNAEFGGTWRVNSYPGAACDIPSHLYSFSFAQNADWSRKFPRQPELLAYAEDIVRRYRLAPHLRLGHGLLAADYDEARGRWRLRTAHGELSARNLVLATGGLSRAALPALPGLDSFAGKVFHSARWDHGYDLRGKRVAVIGTGASAIQFVPEIAPLVAQLDLYQRTAPWVLPRPDRAITAAERWLLRRLPPLRKLYRLLTYVRYESRYLVFAGPSWLAGVAARLGRRHLRRQLPHDAALRARLAPSYRPGCKRMLLSNDYYPALARANVGLHTCGIAAVRHRRRRRRRARRGRHHLRHRFRCRACAGRGGGARARRRAAGRRRARRAGRLQGRHRARLPQYVHDRRPQYGAGPQLDDLHDRIGRALRRRGGAGAAARGLARAGGARRRVPPIQPAAAGALQGHGVGLRLPQLVSRQRRQEQRAVAGLHLRVPAHHAPLRRAGLRGHVSAP